MGDSAAFKPVKSGARISEDVEAGPRANRPAPAGHVSRHRPGGGSLQPVQDVLRTPGQPLSAPVRQEMEARFGADFSGVRLHADTAARASAAAVGARAYTSGDHVVLGSAAADGPTLVHELDHVIQQREGPVSGVDDGSGLVVSDPSDRFERAAEATARHAVRGTLPRPGHDAADGRLLQANRLASDFATVAVQGSVIQRFQGWDHGGRRSPIVVQRTFAQNIETLQENHHGGVKSQYDSAKNIVELHIESGANREGKLMEDLLLALYEARDALQGGQTRNLAVPGHLFMRPQGAQVLKMTMEMLGEAVGASEQRGRAQEAKQARKEANIPLTQVQGEVLDPAFLPEHTAYRESLVGASGVTIKPIGGGSAGMVDMLAQTNEAAAERQRYDIALATLQPLAISVTVDLAVVNRIIDMMEKNAGVFKTWALRLKYLATG